MAHPPELTEGVNPLLTSVAFLLEVTTITFTLTGGWQAFRKKDLRINSDRYLLILAND